MMTTNSMNCTGAGGVWSVVTFDDAVIYSMPWQTYMAQQGQQEPPTANALLSMTPDEALVISTAIALLWAGAWGVRAIKSAIFTTERNADENF